VNAGGDVPIETPVVSSPEASLGSPKQNVYAVEQVLAYASRLLAGLGPKV